MKISIKTSDKKNKYMTHIVVNGIDLGMYASGYQLKQEPGEIPVLSVDIPVTDMDIDLPEGCVIVRQVSFLQHLSLQTRTLGSTR